MAALTSAGVTLNGFYYLGLRPESKRKVVNVTLVLSSQGGLTNNIPASLLGLRAVTRAYSGRDSSSKLYPAGPSYDGTTTGTYLVFYDLTNATDANRNAPADITATVRISVEGTE